MSILQLATPRAFLPLLRPARYKGAHGGRGGAKSHYFAEALIERCVMDPGHRAVCIREVQLSLKESVKKLLEDKIKKLGVQNYFQVQQAQINVHGGGIIIFQGMQNHTSDSIKSLEGFDTCWVEEAQSLSQRSLDLLRPTFRNDPVVREDGSIKGGSEIWFSWNPIQPTDPVDVLLRGKHKHPDSVVIEVNWRDNPWFPRVLIVEKDYDLAANPDKYAHVWEGGYQILTEARIIKNWRIGDTPIPNENDVLRLGGDWGFSIDPSVLVRLFVRGRQMYVDYEAYMLGCETDHLPFLFGGTEDEELRALNQDGFDSLPTSMVGLPGVPGARRWPIKADSSKPDAISYLRRHGFPNIKGAKKGPGSIDEGIKRLESYEIIVHPRCKRAAAELASYSWKTDRHTGELLPIPLDKDNHYMDSMRYATEGLRGGSGGWGVV